VRHRFWRRSAVAFLLLASCWLISWLAARWLIVNAPLEHADVIVVLSGSSTFVERTHLAAELYFAGRAGKIVLTNDNQQGGWLSSEQRNPFFYERARWELERLGVPRERIETICTPVVSTHDEALTVRSFAESQGIRSILVVTSAYHSRRALRTYRRALAGIQVSVGLVAVAPGFQTPNPADWWLFPRGWQLIPVEYVKLIYYLILF
jgi:uncharacterized SAM-binding protein YcdF (DUF218 family)